jgi:hypothetical protein
MRFERFPFDCQLLPIKISLKHDADHWSFVPFGYSADNANGAGIETHANLKQISVLNKKRISFPDFQFLSAGPAITEFGALRTVKVHPSSSP